ncbi:hypothetical protein L6164_033798 [Bauhinia variegata]|uniref:Uncharacterized protein n=1 Tax=Bauhinia variegata TaxID=167791 RepID=A0ACB9KSV6_BAUVA|nr:hypothetical protein L6164_033798 [Bauhinia variegata]
MIPFDSSFDPIRKQRPCPKVDLDEETNRVWALLMSNINNDGIIQTLEMPLGVWDILERLGFMLVFGDLVWIPFFFSIQGWWLLRNKVELTTPAIIANCCVFLIGYLIFRGANKQKHVFKKNPKALIWGEPPKVIGGKLLASGYWGVARHCNYLGDLLLAFSFSLPCGISSPVFLIFIQFIFSFY